MPESLETLKKEVFSLILKGSRREATRLVVEWAQAHGYERAISEFLEPVLIAFGEKWRTSNDLSLGQGYVAGKVAEDVMSQAAATARSGASPGKGPVVIGNVEDDSHSLGRKLVAVLLRVDGWKVIDLGDDVPAGRFVDKAVEAGAPIVAVSALMYRTAMNIRDVRREIDARGLRGEIQLAVGGAVFIQRPELVGIVGGDGTARNAIGAQALMARLVKRALVKEKSR